MDFVQPDCSSLTASRPTMIESDLIETEYVTAASRLDCRTTTKHYLICDSPHYVYSHRAQLF